MGDSRNMFSEQEKKEIVDLIKSDIKEDVFAWSKKWGSIILAFVGILSVIGISVSLLQMYRFIEESIKTKFAEPNIKRTLVNVAENQAKIIIKDEIKPEIIRMKNETNEQLNVFNIFIENFKKKTKEEYDLLAEEIEIVEKDVILFKDYMGKTRDVYNNEYEKLSQQVEILEARNRIVQLADKAIVEGDDESLEKIKEYVSSNEKENLANIAKAEYLRVKKFYLNMTRIKGVDITYADEQNKKYVNEEIPTDILTQELIFNPDWRMRAKAAELLRKRREKDVPEVLLKALKEDPNLDVKKESLITFGRITGFRSSDVLDYNPAIEWWGDNKQEVIKRLKN